MARLPRVVAAGLPHYITQRGNRGEQTFFCDEDYQTYIELMGHWCRFHKVKVLAYCLMPNHVHMIAVPPTADALGRAIGEAHGRYTRMVHSREGWSGHLWRGRFRSFVLDKPHLLTAARYIELNPVRAGLVDSPSRYRWSSAMAHVRREDDALVRVAPLLKLAPDWRGILAKALSKEDIKLLRAHESTGRPLGEDAFLVSLEQELGRVLRRRRPGPQPGSVSKYAARQKPGPKPGSVITHAARQKPGPKPGSVITHAARQKPGPKPGSGSKPGARQKPGPKPGSGSKPGARKKPGPKRRPRG